MNKLMEEAWACTGHAAEGRDGGVRERQDSIPSRHHTLELVTFIFTLAHNPIGSWVKVILLHSHSLPLFWSLLYVMFKTFKRIDWLNQGVKRVLAVKANERVTLRVSTHCQLGPLHKSKQDWTRMESESCVLDSSVLGRRIRIKSCTSTHHHHWTARETKHATCPHWVNKPQP